MFTSLKQFTLVMLAVGAVLEDGGVVPVDALNGVKCSGLHKLELQMAGVRNNQGNTEFAFNETLLSKSPLYVPGATCADGSPIGYYFDAAKGQVPDANTIIWFGNSPICSGKDCDKLCSGTKRNQVATSGVCKGVPNDLSDFLSNNVNEKTAMCMYLRIVCGSGWWTALPKVTPRTLLCQDDPLFGSFNRAYLPACALDWWMGNNTVGNPHRGLTGLNEIFHDMAFRHNLTFSKKVLVGGTSGAAIGVMNNMDYMKKLMDGIHPVVGGNSGDKREVLAILDSAWSVNIEKFAPSTLDTNDIYILEKSLHDNSADWMNNANLNSKCEAFWSGAKTSDNDMRWMCLLPSELIKWMPDQKMLFIQSQYDLVQLDGLGLLNTTAQTQFDSSSEFASGAIEYIENFGHSVRANIESGAAVDGAAKNHHFFLPACGQNGYVVPTSMHTVTATTHKIGEFGSVQFQRDFEVWELIKINGLSVKDSVSLFIVTDGVNAVESHSDADNGVVVRNQVRTDVCGTFLCNNKCTTKILPFEVQSKISKCGQFVIISYGISILLFFYLTFFMNLRKVLAFRRTVAAYWKRIALIENNYTQEGEARHQEVQQQLLNESASTEYRRVHLMVEKLSYWAPPKSRSQQPYKILSDLDLTFAAGHVHAIMGPSGSGKSTLLDILALARDSGQIAGNHYINGVASDSNECAFLREWLRHNSSYVRQTDVLFPLLTVREHLVHAAWLMMPQYQKAESKLRRVWQVLRLLELDGCADTICGDGGVTIEGGISGGQRRRVSVATQLLRMPAVLLLDEPTSGLDSTNALLLCRSLHVFAHEAGMNVLMTIHQPRKEIFEFLDTISFLVASRVIFSGRSEDAMAFFNIKNSINIANDILDDLQGCSDDELEKYEERFRGGELGQAIQEEMNQEITVIDEELIVSLRDVLVENSLAEGHWSWHESSSSATLSWVHMARSIQRGGFDLKTSFIISLVGGVIVGFVFFGIDTYKSRTALAYLTVATMSFLQGTFQGDRYLGEKQMYDHEFDAGTFRNWIAFMISQFARDSITATLEALAFTGPVYWIGGMNPDPERFAVFILIMVLTSFVVLCQNVLIEVDRDDLRIASMLQIGLLGLGALFNGFIIRIGDLPVYLSWVPYVMVSYWSFVATLINDIGRFSLSCSESKLVCAARTGDVVIRTLGYDNRDVYICILVLVIFIIFFRGITLVDFYMRYVRYKGSTIKRAKGKGSDQGTLRHANKLTKNTSSSSTLGDEGAPKDTLTSTLNKMVAASTPRLQRQETQATKSNATPQMGGVIRLNAKPSSSSLGDNGRPTIQNMNDNVMDMDDYFKDREQHIGHISFVMSRFNNIVLDRNLFVLYFMVDFYSAAYICYFESVHNSLGNTIVSMFFLLIYVIFFIYQLCALTPVTLDGKLDCTWAGGYDAIAALSLIIDIALIVNSISTSSEFVMQFVILNIVRLLRFIRVVAYWSKVNAFHEVRARSFLDELEVSIEKQAQYNNKYEIEQEQQPQQPIQQPLPVKPIRPARSGHQPIPGPGNRTSTNINKIVNRCASTGNVPGGNAPNPSRVSATFGLRPTVRSRPPHMPNLGGLSWPEQPEQPAQPKRPQRPQRPQRPVSRSTSDKHDAPPNRPVTAMRDLSITGLAQSEVGQQWRPAGAGAFYNAQTGQVLTSKQLNQRRAAPSPPGPGSGF